MADKIEPKNSQAPTVTGGGLVRASDIPLKPQAPGSAQPKKSGLQWNAEHWGDDPGSFAGWYPGFCKTVERLPEAGDVDGLREFWAFCHGSDSDTNWDWCGEPAAYFLLCRDLVRQGRKPWRHADFHREFIRYLDECVARDDAAAEMAKREADRDERRSRAGRKPTHDSNDALKISHGCGLSRRQARNILRDGTDNRETQGKLAAIFAVDPTRNYRAAWARKTGKWGRGGVRDNFRAYIMAQVAAFEGGEAVDALARAYADTALPVDFNDLAAFLAALAKAGDPISPADAVTVWQAFEFWRAVR